ncbi:MAG: hypothetical protein JWQ71_1656 [Pedosphaera sp.]|nr:hypothetical protein [Pedosphaera sp.]
MGIHPRSFCFAWLGESWRYKTSVAYVCAGDAHPAFAQKFGSPFVGFSAALAEKLGLTTVQIGIAIPPQNVVSSRFAGVFPF